MKKRIIWFSQVILVAYFIASGFWFPWTLYKFNEMLDVNDKTWELMKHFENERDYYFNGANNRGYLDICRKDNKVAVLFKDECPAN